MAQFGEAGSPALSGQAWFATTHWSVVLAAGQSTDMQASAALEELCRTYWYPLYAFVRRQGHSPEAAEDLTQEFFSRLVAKDYLSAVRQERGRFRWFLLCAVKRFLINERERARAAKRGGAVVHLPFDGQTAENRYRMEAADHRTPDQLFDRAWAVAVIERVHRALQEEYLLEGKAEQFKSLSIFLSGDKTGVTHAEAGAQLRMTPGAVKVAVHRLRRRYRELLREHLAQTTRTADELEQELRDLRAAFAG
jgi:DNA-directed RNA polymerase specialized sigma24 family protein